MTCCSLYTFYASFSLFGLDLTSTKQYIFWFHCFFLGIVNPKPERMVISLSQHYYWETFCPPLIPVLCHSACAVEHNLGTDWVKNILANQTQRQIFQQCAFVQPVGQPCNVLTTCRGQHSSGLKKLGSLTVSRRKIQKL